MSTPKTIYLIPGEYEEGLVWCDDPAPDSYSDPDEAVKYVLADHISDSGELVTDNSRVTAELTEEIELLQDTLIKQGKMLNAIVNITKGQPEGNTLHSTHDAVESVERLQSRVAAQQSALNSICTCSWGAAEFFDVGKAASWMQKIAYDALDEVPSTEAFILRK